MENQHKHIKGYRDLSLTDIENMNVCKQLAEEVGNLVDNVEDIPGVDKRWVAVGRTNLQQGFMAVIRGIAKPSTF